MKIIDPGHVGFNLPDYLGKILRRGIRLAYTPIGTEGLLTALERHFPLAEFGWISGVANWVGQGIQALKQLIITGSITPDVSEVTPIVPQSAFGVSTGNRFALTGDIVAIDAAGNELSRRSTIITGNENSALQDLMGEAMYRLLQKIRSTNPQEAEEFEDRFFEAHWLGRFF